MKILLFIRSMAVGGSQRQLAMLATGLAGRSHDVAVVVLYDGEPMETLLAGSGVRLIGLGKSGRWDVFGPLVRLRQTLRSERPDIVYAFQATQTVLASLLLPRDGGKLVFGIRAAGVHGQYYDSLSTLGYCLEARLSRRPALIIANSSAGRDDAVARGMPRDRMVVVPNGIDTETVRPDPAAGRVMRRQWGISDSAFVIGMVARLDPMKDHETFLAGAADFSRLHPDARFVCVGGGPQAYRQALDRRARALGLGERVVWAGEIPDAAAVYSAFDIATLSSAFGEGFPNVVGEAMACERPVVATDVGDSAAIVDRYGETVPPGRPDLLCAGWARLRDRLSREPDLGAAARAFIATHYGVAVMVQRTEALLAGLCKGAANGAIPPISGSGRS
jgi:glycosyltransferase involved in cell wall biosynthesis